MSDRAKFWMNLLAVLAIAVVVARMTVIDVVTIDNNSMAPTLVYGDEVLVWRGAAADRVDVMVCEHPSRDGQLVFGRVVGMPGEEVRLDDNGRLVLGELTVAATGAGTLRFYDVTRKKQFHMRRVEADFGARRTSVYVIEKDQTFRLRPYTTNTGLYLLGDNRSEIHFDSRAFGQVQPEKCIGQIFARWKPAPPTGDDVDNGYLDLIR
ncbi:MAG: signal peptidase I [Myxococcales bacterium]|nr:signal peptidase I [Myxococcales bacterium]